jgi:hypothetical protein
MNCVSLRFVFAFRNSKLVRTVALIMCCEVPGMSSFAENVITLISPFFRALQKRMLNSSLATFAENVKL